MTLRSQRGVTLLELLIAVSLVALLSTGMLLAMRTSVLTYEKTSRRLESNRKIVGIEHTLTSQISGIIPVMGLCSSPSGVPAPAPFFGGNETILRLVTNFSTAEGARGYPQIVQYRVLPAIGGGVRLVAIEQPYTGPQSTIGYCTGPIAQELPAAALPPPPAGAKAFTLADHLAYCRISYHAPYDINIFLEVPWVTLWNRLVLPAGVKIEMRPLAPVAGGLPQLDVTVPIRVTRDPLQSYEDHF